jgi:hypothetical protein
MTGPAIPAMHTHALRNLAERRVEDADAGAGATSKGSTFFPITG